MEERARQLYAELGARPVINAIGNMTMLGGSTPAVEVVEAMQLASRYYVDMDDLLASSGRVIAGMLGCEAALVTSGCAAALLLGTAACMTGDDPERMGQLPDARGMKHEVLMQKSQRYKYDRVVRMAGVHITEAGSNSGTSADELVAGITENTLAMLYPAHDERKDLVPVREAIGICHDHGIPIIVDAASRVYPVEGLRKYAAWGADLVGYGAKYFGALNSTGVLCGRADLVETARLHSFASFERNSLPGIGRPLKVDRQEVAAVVVALRAWLEMDHAARFEAAARRGSALCQALGGVTALEVPAPGGQGAGAYVSIAVRTGDAGPGASDVEEALRAGDPSIWVQSDADSLSLCMLTVRDDDVSVMAARLREVLADS